MIFRTILAFLIVALSIVVGLKLVADPGYLLLAYDKTTVEMPLWFGAILLLLTFILTYFIFRFLGLFRSVGYRIGQWASLRKLKKSSKLYQRGILALKSQEFENAEALLLSGAKKSDNPSLFYLGAAQAAQGQGAIKRRDHYLKAAETVGQTGSFAFQLMHAKWQMEEGEFLEAILLLEGLEKQAPKQPALLRLLKEAYEAVDALDQLIDLLPRLKKAPWWEYEAWHDYAISLYQRTLTAASVTDNATLQKKYNAISRAFRHTYPVQITYLHQLAKVGESETAIQGIQTFLKSNWDDSLIQLYGTLKSENPTKQLKIAETWLPRQPKNPTLLSTLGALSFQNKLWGKARTYYENALAYQPTIEAHYALGQLLEKLDDKEGSLAHYRAGLALKVEG